MPMGVRLVGDELGRVAVVADLWDLRQQELGIKQWLPERIFEAYDALTILIALCAGEALVDDPRRQLPLVEVLLLLDALGRDEVVRGEALHLFLDADAPTARDLCSVRLHLCRLDFGTNVYSLLVREG